MKQIWFLIGLAIVLSGCESLQGPHIDTDSPRIAGRVVDSETGQPVYHARVRRYDPDPQEKTIPLEEKHGGELLLTEPIVFTDQQGWFVLREIRSAYLIFGTGGGFSTTVTIDHPDYEELVTNFDLTMLKVMQTNKSPALNAGTVKLEPRKK